MREIVLTAIAAGLLGGLIGATAYALLLDSQTSPERGTVVRFGGNFSQIEETPFCVEPQRFCLVQLEGGELQALYTYDTHSWSRERNCPIRWLPDFVLTDPDTGESSRGWFRADCSGTTYRYTGEYVFGPGARDMDRFAVQKKSFLEDSPGGDQLEIEYLEVDTRRLICGEPANPSVPRGCERAPRPE